MVRLLLDSGCPLSEVSFVNVCRTHNPELIQLFLDRGADPIKDDPFYEALTCAIRPFFGLFKEYLAKNPALQSQADRALIHHAEQKNPR